MRSSYARCHEANREAASLHNTPRDGSFARRSPKQAGRVSPNGRRSPNSYYDRTTTVRFVLPSTGKLMCTKLNRVVSTMCKAESSGVCLCENFLNGHCDRGNRCHLAHVPRQYLWDYLIPHVNRESYIFEKGFSVRCYTPELDTYYEIPSQFIFQTKGSERFVELYNDNGDNFKEKFCLCPTILETGYCEKGYDCEHVHSSVADLSQFKCIRTHVAAPDTVSRYERLPANVVVRVFYPNGEGEGELFAGDDVLRTVGATQYEEAFNRAGVPPSMKMQHCAHFQNKKMCRLGDGCRFLHVVSLALATPMQEDTISPRLSPVGEASANDSVQDTNAAPQGPNKTLQKKGAAAVLALQGMMRSEGKPVAVAPPEVNRGAVAAPSHPEGGVVIMPAQGGNEELVNRRSPVRRNNPYVQ